MMEFLKGVFQMMDKVVASSSAEDFSQVGRKLVSARDRAREDLQELTARDIQPIIKKLENNEALSDGEKNLVRVWMVGDAEAYTKMENDYREWVSEFKRLTGAIRETESKSGSVLELLNAYGLLEDAVRLAADIQFFLEEKERIGRFEQAIKSLDRADSKMLADILKEKLASPEM
jgi:hypothetical protein